MSFLMKKFLLIIIFFPLITFAQQDTTEKSLVNWLDIQTADSLFQKQPKPMLVDVYTDWCGWCKYMMKTTYSNPNIAGYINQNFYPVRFDAETSDTIVYHGKTYIKDGKTNQLGRELLNNRLSYPTTVFIDRRGQKINVPGYLKTTEIEPFLVYFAEDLSQSVNINEFNLAYMFTYPKNFTEQIAKLKPSEKPDTSGKPLWLSFDEAFEKSKTQKRKYLLFCNVSWCYSCKVMKKITFSDSVIADEINKNFYLIDFDAATEQTINVNGKLYVSMGKGQPNQLAMELFQQNFYFPSVIFLDENFQELTVIRGYLTPKNFEPILAYFSEDAWKTMTYENFIKTFKPKIKQK